MFCFCDSVTKYVNFKYEKVEETLFQENISWEGCFPRNKKSGQFAICYNRELLHNYVGKRSEYFVRGILT